MKFKLIKSEDREINEKIEGVLEDGNR